MTVRPSICGNPNQRSLIEVDLFILTILGSVQKTLFQNVYILRQSKLLVTKHQ
jgi:hypothetical protein